MLVHDRSCASVGLEPAGVQLFAVCREVRLECLERRAFLRYDDNLNGFSRCTWAKYPPFGAGICRRSQVMLRRLQWGRLTDVRKYGKGKRSYGRSE